MNDKHTQRIDAFNSDTRCEVKEILSSVFVALKEKGYNPYTQMVGYILSGDPTYITSHANARATIGRLERDELLEAVLKEFLRDVR